MKKRNRICLLIALILSLSLLLQGCSLLALSTVLSDSGVMDEEMYLEDLFPRETEEEPTEEEPSEEKPTEEKPTEEEPPEEQSPDHIPYEEYERPEEAELEEIPFGEIEYARPDAEAIIAGFAEVQEMVVAEAEVQEIIDRFEAVYTDYTWFYTLSNYTYIRYTLDLSDPYFDEEYRWIEEQSPLLAQAEENCYLAICDSPLRDELEEEYFGEGFFAYYDENQIYSNERVVELMQEESALQAEYMALQNEMTIPWQGEEVLVEDLLGDPSISYNDYLEVYRLYYEKYNPLCAEIFISLIRVRNEIARELGYESYAHFAYEYTYERDYSPEQVEQYTDDIARELSDLYYTAIYGDYSAEIDTEKVMATLHDVAYSFGGDIATAYDYMEAYGLYDISSSVNKMPGSYVTYLYSYGMPYMYITPTGDISDNLTAVHEFGHFVDSYVNCDANSSVDCAEIFSQGLEFLAIDRMELSSWEKRSLTDSKLSDSILTFLGQGCYARFELEAYALPEEELSAETLNELFYECTEEFGMGMYGMEDILAPGWIDIQHFFIAPYYVISYCISNDVALQIYQNEVTDGTGLESYYDLLSRTAGNTILALVEEAGMESPFAPGRMGELADFFSEELE